jgi:hypothetical protein
MRLQVRGVATSSSSVGFERLAIFILYYFMVFVTEEKFCLEFVARCFQSLSHVSPPAPVLTGEQLGGSSTVVLLDIRVFAKKMWRSLKSPRTDGVHVHATSDQSEFN